MEQNRGTALEGVNIIPRGNNVLLKMEYDESILALRSGNKPESTGEEKVTFTVAGMGPLVNDLTLGEEVLFSISGEYVDVPVKNNHNSIRSLKKFYSEMKASEHTELMASGNNKAHVIQYGMFPEFQIKGHIE